MILAGLDAAAELDALDPCAAMTWTAWQRSLLADAAPFRLALTANQLGKTVSAAADVVMEVRGSNPYRPRRHAGPITVVMLGESISQMSAADGPLEKLWKLLPKHEIDPKIVFERGTGIRGVKEPVIRFVRGPGAGSVIQLRTYNQPARSKAGSTVHMVWADEPMPEKTYGELAPRLLRNQGLFLYTLTPVPDMYDQTWAREKAESGVFSVHHVTMKPEHTQPEGFARPLISQAMIDQFREQLPEVERAMRLEASWDPVVTGRWLTNFDERTVQSFSVADMLGTDTYVCIGTDHGLKAGKQASALIVVRDRSTLSPYVWVWDEVVSDGRSTIEEDADGILGMIERNGLAYEDVDGWVGDRSARGGSRLTSTKSNGQLRKAIGEALGRRRGIRAGQAKPKTQWIETPRKWQGSVSWGLRVVNSIMGSQRMVIHPRCEHIIEACQKFQGRKDDPHKDVLDAFRYAVQYSLTHREIGKVKVRAA